MMFIDHDKNHHNNHTLAPPFMDDGQVRMMNTCNKGVGNELTNHFKTDTETERESDEDNQPGEISDDKIYEENGDENNDENKESP